MRNAGTKAIKLLFSKKKERVAEEKYIKAPGKNCIPSQTLLMKIQESKINK